MIRSPLLTALLATTALVGPHVASGVGAGTAYAQIAADTLPTGGQVVSGGVSIAAPQAGRLEIRQSTGSAVVNWQGSSVGRDALVDIQQPGAGSAILNRVTGSTPSTIAGQLNANGQVYLVNPNGIAITRTGSVKAAGFVASTLDIGDDEFQKGQRTFRGNGASAAVSNEGSIAIARGGYAALIGGKASNSGTISVPLGKVALGSGEQATLDLSGVVEATGVSGRNGAIVLSGDDVVVWSDIATGFAGTIRARGAFGTLLLAPYDVTISTAADSGHTAGAADSVINATTLVSALTGANVTVSTGGGTQAGDITVAAPLSWGAATTLTLDAHRSIAVNADISITGGGGLMLTTNNGGSGASASFATGQSGQALTINGQGYTLLRSMADIGNIDNTGLGGRYALAASLDASGTTHTDALAGVDDMNPFTGVFERLGHSISGLTIAKSGDFAGLFGYVGSAGVVRDIGLVGGTVSGTTTIGGLVGANHGTIVDGVLTVLPRVAVEPPIVEPGPSPPKTLPSTVDASVLASTVSRTGAVSGDREALTEAQAVEWNRHESGERTVLIDPRFAGSTTCVGKSHSVGQCLSAPGR